LQSEIKTKDNKSTIKRNHDEKDISTIKQETHKQARLHGKNEFRQWPKSISLAQSKRQKKINCVGRKKAQSIIDESLKKRALQGSFLFYTTCTFFFLDFPKYITFEFTKRTD